MNVNKRIILAVAAAAGFMAILIALVGGYYLVYLEKISGKVIIVQRNAQANMMPLVKVVAIRRKDALLWRDNVARDYYQQSEDSRKQLIQKSEEWQVIAAGHDRTINQHKAQLAVVSQLMAIAHRVWLIDAGDSTAKSKFFLLLPEARLPDEKLIESLAMSSEWQTVYHTLKRDAVPRAEAKVKDDEDAKEKDALAHAEEFRSLKASLERRLAYLVSDEYLSRIPNNIEIVTSDRTDESGGFVLRLPRGDYYLFAQASRDVFENVEKYYWAQPVTAPSQESSKCLLGNMNLVGSGEGDLWQGLRTRLYESKQLK